MKTPKTPSEDSVLEAISRDDVDNAAEQLAALRIYAEHAEDPADASQLTFDRIRSRLEITSPSRGLARRVFPLAAGGLGLVAAGILFLVIRPDVGGRGRSSVDAPLSEPTLGMGTSQRLKGLSRCCGAVTLRLGIQGGSDDHLEPLPSRVVAEGQTLGVFVAATEGTWASVYDIHLASKRVQRIAGPDRVEPAATPAASFVPTLGGKHVLLLVVTQDPSALGPQDVITLLLGIGEGKASSIEGEPCSVDLYELEVAQ